MKVRKYQGSEETTILTALITHDKVLSKIYQNLGKERKPFRSKYSNIVARLCFDYYAKYQKAPGKTIESLFHKYAREEQDASAIDLVEQLLSSLSNKYESTAKDINEQWTVDLASRFFDKIRLERTADGIAQALEREDLDEARRIQQGHKPLEFSSQDWIEPFREKVIHQTLDDNEREVPLVRFKGGLAKFLSPAFVRGGFISFVAPDKRGKSFWLLDVVWRALEQRRKVLYYVLGDLSQREALLRLYQRAALHPLRAGKVKWPTKIIVSKGEDVPLVGETEEEERKLDALSAFLVKQEAKKTRFAAAMRKLPLKMRCAGADVISASMIEADVDEFAREGWAPDLVVVDYADLLLTEAGAARMDLRHQIDATWRVLRRIALDKSLLVVTATQSSAKAYDGWIIRKKHFSEDKRKNAHVTGMLGINQTSEEKEKGIYRLNWLALRSGKWTDSQVCWTAGNLDVCAVALRSLVVRQ